MTKSQQHLCQPPRGCPPYRCLACQQDRASWKIILLGYRGQARRRRRRITLLVLSFVITTEEKEDSPPQSSSLFAPVLRCTQVDILEPLDKYNSVCIPVFKTLIVKPSRPTVVKSNDAKIERQARVYVVAQNSSSIVLKVF